MFEGNEQLSSSLMSDPGQRHCKCACTMSGQTHQSWVFVYKYTCLFTYFCLSLYVIFDLHDLTHSIIADSFQDHCIVCFRAQSFQDSFDFEKEFEAGMCDKEALKWKENLEFINAAPDYKGLFAKFESLKEKIALETRLDAILKEAAANFAHAAQNKIQNSVGNVIQKLAEERLTMADILTPDLNIDSDGIMIPSFLNTSNSQIDEKENCMS